MKFFDFLKRFFGKKPQQSISETIDSLDIGDIVEVSFLTPNELGIDRPDSLTSGRLNVDEIANPIVKGTVTKKSLVSPPLNQRMIEVSIVKKVGHVRRISFLESEIKQLKKIA